MRRSGFRLKVAFVIFLFALSFRVYAQVEVAVKSQEKTSDHIFQEVLLSFHKADLYRGYEVSDLPCREILALWNILNKNTDYVAKMPLNLFVDLLKLSSHSGGGSREITHSMETLLVKNIEILLCYLIKKDSQQNSRLSRFFALRSSRVFEENFLHFARMENDIFFTIAFLKEVYGLKDPVLNEIQENTVFRLRLAYQHFAEQISNYDELISAWTDENLASKNQNNSRDFDHYGRYGQAGDLMLAFKKEIKKMTLAEQKLYKNVIQVVIENFKKEPSPRQLFSEGGRQLMLYIIHQREVLPN